MAGAAAKKKGPPDLVMLLGEPKGEGEEGDDPLADMAAEEPSEGDELPPGFQTAADELAAAEVGSAEWASALYRTIEACKAGA